MKVLTVLLLLLSAALPVFAQTRIRALVLPLEVTSGFQDEDDDRLGGLLQKRLQELSPGAEIQVARTAELTAYGFRVGGEQPPTPLQSDTIARAYGSRYLCWTGVQFTPNYDKPSKMLTMAGAARLWVYDAEKKTIMIDQAASLLRTRMVKNARKDGASQAQKLLEGCLNDLAVQLVTVAHERQEQPAAAQQPAPPVYKPSSNYQRMERAIKEYQRVARGDAFFDAARADKALSDQWLTLTRPEQDHLSETYPAIVESLRHPAPAYGNGLYWPYYYQPYNNRPNYYPPATIQPVVP